MQFDTTTILKARNIVRDNAPYDTGNLAFNSIQTVRTSDGFAIIQLGSIAPYGSILNEGVYAKDGRPINTMHQGWWERAHNMASEYINGVLEGGTTTSLTDEATLRAKAQDNPARQQRMLYNLKRMPYDGKQQTVVQEIMKQDVYSMSAQDFTLFKWRSR